MACSQSAKLTSRSPSFKEFPDVSNSNGPGGYFVTTVRAEIADSQLVRRRRQINESC